MAYFIFAVRVYRKRLTTAIVALFLKLLGFDIRVEVERDPEKSERALQLFDKAGKRKLKWVEVVKNGI